MEAFWVRMFDARVLFRGRMFGQPYVRLLACGITLIFREDPAFVAPPGPGEERQFRTHLGLRCADLEAAILELEARGAVFVVTPAVTRQMLATAPPGAIRAVETTYICPPLTRERIDAGEYQHQVALLVGPDHLWIELNQITEPADTGWYPPA